MNVIPVMVGKAFSALAAFPKDDQSLDSANLLKVHSTPCFGFVICFIPEECRWLGGSEMGAQGLMELGLDLLMILRP